MIFLSVLFYILMIIVNITYYYNTFLTFFGWHYKDEKLDKLEVKQEQTFKILIACHNEEQVIADNLKAIYNSTYNKNKYSVSVICDNCQDKTEEEVWKFALEHEDMKLTTVVVKGGSKPKALNLAIGKLKETGEWYKYNNVIVLDADNKISPTMLSTYNKLHNNGHKILQCRILSDNDDSFIAKGYTSAFNNMAYSFQIARNRLGLSGSLSGTGFSVDREVFDKVDFLKCHTLTEDLEFSIHCILNGFKIKYVHSEYVLNQNLDSFKPSIVQRIRWNRGTHAVSKELRGKVFKKFLKERKWQYLDSLIFITCPSRSLIYIIAIILSFITINKVPTCLAILNILLAIYNIIFIVRGNKWKLQYLLPHIFYSITMMFLIPYGALTYKNTKWAKTKHVKIIH